MCCGDAFHTYWSPQTAELCFIGCIFHNQRRRKYTHCSLHMIHENSYTRLGYTRQYVNWNNTGYSTEVCHTWRRFVAPDSLMKPVCIIYKAFLTLQMTHVLWRRFSHILISTNGWTMFYWLYISQPASRVSYAIHRQTKKIKLCCYLHSHTTIATMRCGWPFGNSTLHNNVGHWLVSVYLAMQLTHTWHGSIGQARFWHRGTQTTYSCTHIQYAIF